MLFLDDLQWADAPSLQLIEHLLTHPDTRYLLLIAAYRDNEVSAAHPLTTTLDAIRNNGATVINIQLAPLSVMHLSQLVADTLHAQSLSCEPLTHLVFGRTEGNPFFFIQFLDSLHKGRLLQWNAISRLWQWDIAQIRSRNFADNVADLMVAKLRQLPVETQQALQLAACLGNKFDLLHLALVSRFSEEEAGQRLSAAVCEGLIALADGRGKFLHDRIQQAAYVLIPEARRAEVHLRIGRRLMTSLTEGELAEHLFDVANQLNLGAALLIDRDEKAQIAQLNLRAGRKAKASTAYPSACVYFAAGMALLGESCWSSQYELAFNLGLERATCEFLNGNFELSERLIAELLLRVTSKIDKAATYYLQVEICEVKSENRRAVANALECLRLFGIEMPAHPSRAQVQAEYDKFWQNLGERTIESLIDLPMMTNPEILAAMHMLSALFTLKDVPIIAISASASGDAETNSLLAGADAFLPKPIDLRRLLAQIAALLKLTWTYELSQTGSPLEQQAAAPLLVPPAEEMKILHRLARLGNMGDIVQWANCLAERDEPYRPFVNQLCVLAQGYQSKAILSMVERYLKEQEART